jgi:hypothetical protein
MNPDVTPSPGCVPALLSALDRGADVAGPRLYCESDKRWLSPPNDELGLHHDGLRRLARLGGDWARLAEHQWRRHARKHWLARAPLQSFALSGAMLALTRRTWNSVGPFDDLFQLYFEETDWLLRLKRLGLRAWYVPEAEAVHLGGRSAAREPAIMAWFAASAARFEQKHYGAALTALLHAFTPRSTASPAWIATRDTPIRDWTFESVPSRHWPLWVELSPSPLGFPAAVRIMKSGAQSGSQPLDEIAGYLFPGTYYIRVTDRRGHTLERSRLERAADLPVTSY